MNRTSGSFYIDTQNKLRDAHLRSAAFFEVNSIFALFGRPLSGGEEVVLRSQVQCQIGTVHEANRAHADDGRAGSHVGPHQW